MNKQVWKTISNETLEALIKDFGLNSKEAFEALEGYKLEELRIVDVINLLQTKVIKIENAKKHKRDQQDIASISRLINVNADEITPLLIECYRAFSLTQR